ncbi:MAG: ABC transporter substrate-binding protein [Rectinemataceae bacterium]
MRRRLLCFCALASITFLSTFAQTPPGDDASVSKKLQTVSLQLKWYHQFQFAGYYAAEERGYYRDEGLDVRFIEGTPSTRYTQAVLAGKAQFGINNTDILIDRVHGLPVVVLGVIFQHSPVVLLSLRSSHLESPKDFIGKRVMVSAETETETYSIFRSESIDPSLVHFIPNSSNLGDLIDGATDAVSAYSTNEVVQLRLRGVPYAVLRPLTYGIDFYGDCLFTTEGEIRRHPALVAGFLRATVRGWEYAMDHPEEICDLILAKYSKRKSRQELLLEAKAMQDLIVPRLVPIGFMNPGRWKSIGDTYARLGSIPANYSLDGFLYDPARPEIDPRFLRIILLAVFAMLAGGLAYIVILRTFNRRLGVEVGVRTRNLEDLNRKLEVEVEERRTKEMLLADSLKEKEILLREIHHRVKNNLQIISSIVNLEMGGIEEESTVALLREIKNRVRSMALVHEHLYESAGLAGIDMKGYVLALVQGIMQSYRLGDAVPQLKISVDDISLPIEQAIPLGLVIGELVANSMKYAFAGRSEGSLEISLEREEGNILLVVADDGKERESETEPPARRGIGLDLVQALVDQIKASMAVDTGRGRVTRIRIPLPWSEDPAHG